MRIYAHLHGLSEAEADRRRQAHAQGSDTRTVPCPERGHRIGSEKQAPIVTHGSVNDAMNAVEIKLSGGWSDIVRSWENTL
jgi:hypothetical protein